MPKKPTQEEIANAIREQSRLGRPEYAFKLRELRESGEEIPSHLLDFSGLKPQKETTGILEAPPRAGKGSATENWVEFAKDVSDLDDAVIEKMTRDEIIEILENREIIPTPEEEEKE